MNKKKLQLNLDGFWNQPKLESSGNRSKVAQREAKHSPPTSAKVKKTLMYKSTPPYALWLWCLISYAQGRFCFFYEKYDLIDFCR
jgi:hypothetical protein